MYDYVTIQFVNFKHSMFMPQTSQEYLNIRVITKLPNSEQSYKGKVKTHNYINRQNQSTTGKLKTNMGLDMEMIL